MKSNNKNLKMVYKLVIINTNCGIIFLMHCRKNVLISKIFFGGVILKEYRKYGNLNPVILYKEDLLELEEMSRKDTATRKEDFNISLTDNDTSYKFSSFEDLFCEKEISKINSITITVVGWSVDNKIEKHIYLNINPSSISYDISSTNEIWNLGKIAQINAFFKKRKLWYSFITKYLLYFLVATCSALMGIGNQVTIPIRFVIPAFIYLIVSIFIAILCISHKIFRYTTIYLCSKNKTKIDANIILIVLTLIATIIGGIIIPFIKK